MSADRDPQHPAARPGEPAGGQDRGGRDAAGWAWWWQARAGHVQAVSGRAGSSDIRQEARTRQRLERLARTRHLREHARQQRDDRRQERREDRGGGGLDER